MSTSASCIPPSSVSLFVHRGCQVLGQQLFLLELKGSLKKLASDLSSPYSFIRLAALKHMIDMLHYISCGAVDVEHSSGSGGSRSELHQVYDNMSGYDERPLYSACNDNISMRLSTSQSQALRVISKILSTSSSPFNGAVTSTSIGAIMNLLQSTIFQTTNFISPLFHVTFPRRDLSLALCGGGGVPLPTLPKEAAIQWSTLETPGHYIRTYDIIDSNGGYIHHSAPSPESTGNNTTSSTTAGDNTTPTCPHMSGLLTIGSSALTTSSVSVPSSVVDGSSGQGSPNNINARELKQRISSSYSSPVDDVGKTQQVHTPTSHSMHTSPFPLNRNTLLEASVKQSIKKGIESAKMALFPTPSLLEQEYALRVIQGLCVIAPHNKALISDSPFIPFVIESCWCCLQHVQQLSLVERSVQQGASETLVHALQGAAQADSVTAAYAAQQHQEADGDKERTAENINPAATVPSATPRLHQPPQCPKPQHREISTMRPELISVMCAMVDALEAAAHYSPRVLGLLVQLGGVKHLLMLACCPYTPIILRCCIFDTISFLMKEVEPFRRAVTGADRNTVQDHNDGCDSDDVGEDDRSVAPQAYPQQLPSEDDPTLNGDVTAMIQRRREAHRQREMIQSMQVVHLNTGGNTDLHNNPAGPSNEGDPVGHFQLDRATASKFDSAVRTWLSKYNLFSVASILLDLRDIGNVVLPQNNKDNIDGDSECENSNEGFEPQAQGQEQLGSSKGKSAASIHSRVNGNAKVINKGEYMTNGNNRGVMADDVEVQRIAHRANRQREIMYCELLNTVNQRMVGVVEL